MQNGIPKSYQCGCVCWHHPVRTNDLHRLDGFASDASKCTNYCSHASGYYLDGEGLTEENWAKKVEEIKKQAIEEIGEMIKNCWLLMGFHGYALGDGRRADLFQKEVQWRAFGGQMPEGEDLAIDTLLHSRDLGGRWTRNSVLIHEEEKRRQS